MSRLIREYRKIEQTRGFISDNILVRPLPDKLHEWHFLLFDLGRPFTGGIYHGMLKFPKDYPFAPPAIFMVTPNGRFETNRRLCFSMSDYHPETWNPLWTVETLLIGFASFMFGACPRLKNTDTESKMIGYVKSSDEEKLQLARMSYTRVTSESLVLSLFPILMQQGHYRIQHRIPLKPRTSAAIGCVS
ncbi:MAG: hypothetical protein KVP17_001626 [Porospora cf. gigantea B]|uniref:uncharacterized protein n=1 Tax=Porospora cf. gigantea B TaxID=2853592 RepID=UPI003571B879|nr:MAG: hypothetical protein KVP17_001626 [Porospora cf. gigantea B]